MGQGQGTWRREIGPGDFMSLLTLSSRHLFRLVDVSDGRHLAVFVRSEYLAHGARGHAVGDAVNVELLPLVSVARGHLLLPLRRGLAAAEVMKKGEGWGRVGGSTIAASLAAGVAQCDAC